MTALPAKSQPSAWADWQTTGHVFTQRVLAEILDGGQSFRWRCDAAGTWTGVWCHTVAQLKLNESGRLCFRTCGDKNASVKAVQGYLRLDDDFAAMVDRLPWRSDPHLAQCLAAFPGLRIPRQPFGETLLCFLCSATKQIVQIKEMVALLASLHGDPIAPGIHALPTWEQLAVIPDDQLRQCLLGFRARYISATAQFLKARPGWLNETEHLSYPAAKTRLMELPGVGEKVADCVLLFGAGKLEAFPVDTWILKAMAIHYQLADWKPAQVAHFGRQHFGSLAGFAQQYLFAYERSMGRNSPS